MSGQTVYEITPDEAAEAARLESKVVPGRSCGSCSLCCKVLSIPLFGKAAGQWCAHARPGKGCGIYKTRPFVCRSALCHWMMASGLGSDWKPDTAKFALFVRSEGARITAHVDPGWPLAWKRQPYYGVFKRWAAEGLRKRPIMHLVDIVIGDRVTVILPDRDVELGAIGEGSFIKLEALASGGYGVRVLVGEQAPALASA